MRLWYETSICKLMHTEHGFGTVRSLWRRTSTHDWSASLLTVRTLALWPIIRTMIFKRIEFNFLFFQIQLLQFVWFWRFVVFFWVTIFQFLSCEPMSSLCTVPSEHFPEVPWRALYQIGPLATHINAHTYS